ncbi:MAG: hypothetical protein HN778_13185 [Prolixibacteraceae bacterium]|jgi:hypothetical protein|nr:hypothetical protein [Prolixibacteraceae bacterium]MBT6764670.1 hypothetical protein [Prolixibacteraceae bacterium]MBT7000415.1 hypothetical protein [Prolixibacteraceae bacterium]MBT7395782.1 hypothetical protein [Prolixibacteraceae bacterium]
MKEKYSSFISEHTAEYVLIPQLTDILKQKFEVVIPIYPWMTREGNNLSKSLHQQYKFRMVGFYPRRPKIGLKNHKMAIKINDEFLDGAKEASKINIPMLAGCPLARNLLELNNDVKCIWIKLTDKTRNIYDIEYIDETPVEYKVIQHEEVFNTKDNILDFIIEGSKELNFLNLIQAIQTIRQHSSTVYFMGFGTYKPIYFLLKDER